MGINLTPVAADEVRRVLDKQGKSDWGIRLGVKGGGCSGLSYTMDLAEKPAEKDRVSEIEGIKIFVDPKSYLYLNGLTLAYSTALMGGGFQFNNPNATQTCSCGESFSA